MKVISIKKIAELAGVSSATVSRVLNNSGRFSEETRHRVMEVVEQLDYRTNIVAKSLRTNKSQSIGVAVPDITNEFFSHIVLAIENYCFPRDYSVLICNTNESEEKEKTYMRSLLSKGVDGVIYLASGTNIDRTFANHLPIVCIDRPSGQDNIVVVESDNRYGGFLATEALIKKDCKRIIILRDQRKLLPMVSRYQGYYDALKKYGIQIDESLVIDIPVHVEAARQAVNRLIYNHVRFDGVFATTDWLAVGALTALKQNHVLVPEQVKLVGFDNISAAEYSSPGITSINQHKQELGERAAKILLNIINHEPVVEKRIVLPVELVRRGTV